MNIQEWIALIAALGAFVGTVTTATLSIINALHAHTAAVVANTVALRGTQLPPTTQPPVAPATVTVTPTANPNAG